MERIETHGVADTDGNLGLYRVGRVLEAGQAPERGPAPAVLGGRGGGRAAPDRVRSVELLRRGHRCRGAARRCASRRACARAGDAPGLRVRRHDPLRAGARARRRPHRHHRPAGRRGSPARRSRTHCRSPTSCSTSRPPTTGPICSASTASRARWRRSSTPSWRRRLASSPSVAGDEPVAIEIDDLDGCPRYVGRLFRDVTVAPSPHWLKARLLAAGMRPISNVVDVTNYVMHALGSPLHAFDFDKLAGGRIGVRRATKGEKLRTLDGQERALEPDDLLITDGERPIAIAGIMGGEETEVSESTTSVLLEAANFEAVGVMRSSERLRLRSEASNRWEKGIDPEVALQASRFATELLVSLTGARWTGHADVRAEPQPVADDRLQARPRKRSRRPGDRGGRAAPPPRAPGVRGRRRLDRERADVASRRRDPRDRSRRGSRALRPRARARDAAGQKRAQRHAHRRAADPPPHPGHARRVRLRRGLHVEPLA